MRTDLQSAIRDYFAGEYFGSMALAGVGIVCVVYGIVLAARRHPRWPAAPPLILVGLVWAVVGVTVLQRTDGQVETMVRDLRINAQDVATSELVRIAQVQLTFHALLVVELCFVGLGAALCVPKRLRMAGVALLAMALASLGYDQLASARAATYATALQAALDQAPPAETTP